jgi:hypothetical protein
MNDQNYESIATSITPTLMITPPWNEGSEGIHTDNAALVFLALQYVVTLLLPLQKKTKMSPWTDPSVSGQRQLAVVIGTVVASVAAAVVVHQVASRPKKLPTDASRPPHLWSWIPYLGSAIEMGKGITSFIRSRASQLKSPIFTATIMGDKCVFLADPGRLYAVTASSESA